MNKIRIIWVGVGFIVIPIVALLLNLVGGELTPVFHPEAAKFLKDGGSIATEKLNAFRTTRIIFLFLGIIGGFVSTQAVFYLLQPLYKKGESGSRGHH